MWRTLASREAEERAREWGPVLSHLPALHALWGEIVCRPTAIDGDRPQDFVAAVLATTSFRSALVAVELRLMGYEHGAVGLDRTNQDISLRLYQILKKPVEASIGLFMSSLDLKVSALEKFHALPGADPHRGNLDGNLARLLERRDQFCLQIAERGLDPVALAMEFGQIGFGKVARSISEEDGKQYAFSAEVMGGVVHGRLFGFDDYVVDKPGAGRLFASSPCYGEFAVAGVADSIRAGFLNLAVAGEIVGLQGTGSRLLALDKGLDSALVACGLPPADFGPIACP